MTYEQKMERLRDLGDMQGEMAAKATAYRAKAQEELAMRFERASLAATNARMLMHAALMAERETEIMERIA